LIRYYPTAGDKHGWAIDEDRRLIRRALRDVARESSIWRADVVHTPFWMALAMHDPEVLRRKFVIAHADNPPFFYLNQPEFAAGQGAVDLWVARSREAMEQFAALGLRAEHVPYAIDESVFFPIPDRVGLRGKYGIPLDAYIIGNFHRDSEGSDLSQPKLQKAPETMLAILREVRAAGYAPHVLLAGPRRHWIRRELTREGIPFTFVGKQGVESDDFGVNILSRETLNELYNACDLYLVPSRWEGGPQSAMEAAAARVKILSFPLGVARDILEPDGIFDTPAQAASKIVRDIKENVLASSLDTQRRRLLADHTAGAMEQGLRRLYESLPGRLSEHMRARGKRTPLADMSHEIAWQFARRRPRRLAQTVRFSHTNGADAFMDEAMENLTAILGESGISADGGARDPVVAGHAGGSAQFRVLPSGGEDCHPGDRACRIALSVQDAVNFKASGNKSPAVVCPLVFAATGRKHPRLVVDEGNKSASLDIWRCMLDAGTPVYPGGTAYYYQVFHAGVSYGADRSKEEAYGLADRDADALQALARPPTRDRAAAFWRGLLRR
jgi:glycosyltransferase involved in cell wall biosynthesis